ncbi:MAG: hypothetical protein AAGU27_03165 [Dehalobacterium sp.]
MEQGNTTSEVINMGKKHHQRQNKAENQTFDIRENMDHGVHTPTKENQILYYKAKKEKE